MEAAVDPRYPIGRLEMERSLGAASREEAIALLARLPGELTAAVAGLTDAQLDTPYRDGGWTVRQVVHHLADSHMHAYLRCKLVVSEQNPPLKGYDENAWAAVLDARTAPLAPSLSIVEGLHRRWTQFLHSLHVDDFARTGLHSERGPVTLDMLLQTYSWHGRHHVAHITELRKRQAW